MPKKFDHTKYRLVKIMWRDAQDFDNGWHDLKKIQAAPTEPVQSIGWLVTDKDDRVVLSADFCSDGTSGRAIAIPKTWCLKITDLQEVVNDKSA